MITKAELSVIVGIVIGGITLALIPLIVLSMKKAPRRDRKHRDSDKL